jgi:aminoacyl tRNA synthase complex-interacting multifunctional protein 1
MKSVTSSAAIAKLTLSESDLMNDILLQWIIALATPLRLTVVVVAAKKNNSPLLLELLASDKLQLSQRNAIVRCLCGMGLHNALDTIGSTPCLTMGGHSSAVAASPYHAMALASMNSWMSVADTIRQSSSSKNVEEVTELLVQLNAHLTTRSFLVPSSQCTIADVDVAMVLLQYATKDSIASYPNVQRWVIQCCATVQSQGVKIPATLSYDSSFLSSIKPTTPIFFDGTEEVVVPPTSQQGPKASAAAVPAAGGGKENDATKEAKDNKQQQPQPLKEGKKGKEKKDKQTPASATAAAAASTTPADSEFDVSALDIRVGQIIKVWPHPESEKLYCEEIDVGEAQPRQIASGLRPFYETSELENRRVIVLCNLKKRNLVGFASHGMVLCASNADHTAVECMEPPADAKIGERVVFEGYTADQLPEPENKIQKKKIFEVVAPDLKTNDAGICVWKGAVSQTSAGPIKASKGMPNAQVA